MSEIRLGGESKLFPNLMGFRIRFDHKPFCCFDLAAQDILMYGKMGMGFELLLQGSSAVLCYPGNVIHPNLFFDMVLNIQVKLPHKVGILSD